MSIKKYIINLAEENKITYKKTANDALADDITRLAGDTVVSDETEELLLALYRAEIIDQPAMVDLHNSYLKEAKGVQANKKRAQVI